MSNEEKPSEKCDFITSLAQANGFYYVSLLLDNIDGTSPSKLFCSAVNLCFSLELLLKSLIIMQGKTFKNIHSLSKLFNELDEKIKNDINKAYAYSFDIKSELFVKAGINLTANKNIECPNSDMKNNVEGLLKLHDKTFVDFRYAFEKGRKSPECFYYDPKNLQLVVEILKCICASYLDKAQILKVRDITGTW